MLLLTSAGDAVKLNVTAALVWYLLEEDHTTGSLVDELASTTGQERESIASFVEGTLATFAELGLVVHL